MLAERVNKWIAEYKAEGKAEGIQVGKQEERASLLKRMKKAGLSVTEIAQITGLPEDEIRHYLTCNACKKPFSSLFIPNSCSQIAFTSMPDEHRVFSSATVPSLREAHVIPSVHPYEG